MNVATYGIQIEADGSIRGLTRLDAKLRGTEQQVSRLDRSKKALEATARRVGAVLGVSMVASLVAFVKNTSEAQKVQAQLGAVLRSTGGAAQQSLRSLNAHAAALQKVTTFGDDSINAMQGVLLTFTQIRGPQFTRATEAVLDMAQALGMDLQSAAIQVGKALNDPILGVTSLSRAGVQFSVAQRAVIRDMVETGRIAEAQTIILKELETQFGGSARAARNTLGGALESLRNVVGDLFEFSVDETKGIVGAINAATDALPGLRTGLDELLSSWEILLVDIELAVARLDRRLARINVAILRFAQGGNIRKALGMEDSAWLVEQQERLANAEADIAALENLKLERQKRLANQGREQVEVTERQTQALQRQAQALRQLQDVSQGGSTRIAGIGQGTAGVTTTARFRELTQFGVLSPSIPLPGIERMFNAVGMAAAKQLAEVTRVFIEQTQQTIARFFSDFFREGFRSMRSFWESFKTFAFDTLGQIAARNVMDRIGGRIQAGVNNIFGTGIIGSIAGGLAVGGAVAIASAIGDKLFGRSQWEETIQEINRSLKAQAEAAGDMARAAAEGLARWRDDFLNFANRETPEERQIRNLTNQYNQLAQQAFDVAVSGGASFTNRFQNLINQGRFEEAERLALSDSFNRPGTPGYQAVLDFIESLKQLREAMGENVQEVYRLAAAERALSLTRTIEGLETFRRDLRQSDLSIYSPFQQLDDARTRYEQLVAAAQGGDQSAAEQLPAAARAFLEQSRRINASGARYVADFQRVEREAQDIQTMFEGRRDAQQAIADGLTATANGIVAVNLSLERQDSYLEAQVTLQQSIASGIVELREALVLELEGVRRELRTMQESAVAVGGVSPILMGAV